MFSMNKLVSRVKFDEFREKVRVKFSVDSNKYIIAKLNEVPEFSVEIFSIIRDRNEITVIAKEGSDLQPVSEERFFRLITVDVMLPFDLTGFLSHVSVLLASKNIPILTVSAYSTDHIFVREENLDAAVEVLKKDGMAVS